MCISIGITAFNEGNLLLRAWKSVESQSDSNWKAYIVLDGNATPETEAIFDSIEDHRLTKIKLTKNIGPYPTRRVFLEHCTDKDGIVMFLDADDYFTDNAFAVVRSLFYDETVDWVSASVRLFWTDITDKLTAEIVIPGKAMSVEEFIMGGIFPGLAIFRKRLYDMVGGYDPVLERGKADFDLWLNILANNYKSAHSEKIILHKQERTYSVSRSYDTRMHEVHRYIISKHSDIFSERQLHSHFLHQGIFTSANAHFVRKNRSDAACLAREGILYARPIDYFPIQYCDQWPWRISNILLKTKEQLRKLRHKRLKWLKATK